MAKFTDKIKALFKNKIFLIGAASFMLPALALYIIFAFNGVHPFGDRQILVTDLWHQYYPFLCTLQEKLQAGESLLYSETIGMGINFWALIAYYCASPLNILVAFTTKANLRDLLVIIVVMKIGFSGLFFSMYLKKVFKRYDFSTVAFSMIYALCGYVLGYYWNIMWLDCVYMLPLVMLGVYSLIKENKFVLYIISLAVAVISNFYIGFMVCIFTAIYFFVECAKTSMKLKQFFKKLGLIAVCSVVSLALTAFISIPAYLALQDTVATVPKNSSAEELGFIEQLGKDLEKAGDEIAEDLPDILGRLASFNTPEPKEGLPNIFSGFISIILIGYFLASRKIELREKIATMFMILLLFLSMAVSDIDIIWHGFHKPNMVPYRYAFVMSFALITLAYRTFNAEFLDNEGVKNKSKIPFILSLFISIAVIVCALAEAETSTILACSALAILYFVILLSCMNEKNENMKKKWSTILCAVVVIEVIINTIIAVPTVRTTTYSGYYYRGEEIEKLLEAVDADSSYGRVETAQEYILNDPALYGYKGVSTFTSTANVNITKLMEKLAICGLPRSNRYYYETTSPLTNSFLGIEHVIFKNNMKNLNPYLEHVASEWTSDEKYENAIYENTENLPLGFMVENTLLDENELIGSNAFEIQNDLFRKATGLEEDLFTRIPLRSVSSSSTIILKGAREGDYSIEKEENADKEILKVNYTAPDENSVYAYIDGSVVSKVKVSDASYKAVKRKYIFPAGSYSADEKFTFDFSFEDTFTKKSPLKFHVYSLNEELFEKGMDLLRDEPFEITRYTATRIEGTVNAQENGVFYTSIPYEKGWRMYVDGEEVAIEPFENAFIATHLPSGEHEIILKYSPYGFVPGVVISVAALALLIVAILLLKKNKSLTKETENENN